MLQKLLFIVVACMASNLLADKPLLLAHSHNDYAHARPLADALDNSFCSVEADIFLVDGKLLIGHTLIELHPSRTLQSLYLDPLKHRIHANGGRVYRDGPPFTLMIDIKTDAKSTYKALAEVLLEYRDILTEYSGEAKVARAIEVVISGNRDFETIESDSPRLAGIDGRMTDLDSTKPSTLIPMISDRWASQFTWNGEGEFPAPQREKLHAAVAKAHAAGRRVRFWATPENKAVWQELKAAKVDLINTDKLQDLRQWLESQQPQANIRSTESVFIDTSIENASPVWYEVGSDGAIVVYLMYDHERNAPNRAAGHLHFKVEAKPQTKLTMEIRNLENIYNGRPGSVANEMHRLVVSNDGINWRSVETEVLENRVRLALEFESKPLYVARVEPYRISDLDRLLQSIAGHRLVNIATIGKTVDGRELEIVRIGDENAKHHVFLRARAHPWEAGGNWVVEGMVKGLLSEDDASQKLLKHCCIWILPMANKDGVARGRTRFNMLGRDLNRNWDVPADKATSPENFALERWLESRLNAGKRIDFALEIHNDGNGRLHHTLPPETERTRYRSRIATFETLLRKNTWFSVGHSEGSLATYTLPNGWQHRYGIDGAVHEFNCQWIETLKVGPLKDHWMEYGRGLIKVFDQFLEP